MDKFNELQNILEESKEDFIKFYVKGNKSAGTRIRKKMQELKAAAQNVRIHVGEVKKK